MSKLKLLIVILGPTASGKTSLSIELAKKFSARGGPALGWDGIEIISADSRQIYRDMDIGTDKVPTDNGQQTTDNRRYPNIVYEEVPHYMIDIISPDEEFSVQDFKKMAIEIINDIHARNKLPFLVGGTGLYISAIVDNLEIPEIPANKILREKLEAKTNEELFENLKKVDMQTAETIDPNNKRRLVRALEVCILSGSPFSSQRNKGKPLFDVLQIGISLQKEKLYEKIDQRLNEQIETGLEDEVRNLKEKYGCRIPPMTGFIYKEMCEYIEGKISLDQALRKMKSSTKKYAKRQMTWFKRDPRIHWVSKEKEATLLIKDFL